jgi:hypothetical protein
VEDSVELSELKACLLGCGSWQILRCIAVAAGGWYLTDLVADTGPHFSARVPSLAGIRRSHVTPRRRTQGGALKEVTYEKLGEKWTQD